MQVSLFKHNNILWSFKYVQFLTRRSSIDMCKTTVKLTLSFLFYKLDLPRALSLEFGQRRPFARKRPVRNNWCSPQCRPGHTEVTLMEPNICSLWSQHFSTLICILVFSIQRLWWFQVKNKWNVCTWCSTWFRLWPLRPRYHGIASHESRVTCSYVVCHISHKNIHQIHVSNQCIQIFSNIQKYIASQMSCVTCSHVV